MSRRSSPTGSARTALLRLIDALGPRGVRVSVKKKKGDRFGRMIVERDGRRRVVFGAHPSGQNLELLKDLAHYSRGVGGAGMSWAEIKNVTGHSSPTH